MGQAPRTLSWTAAALDDLVSALEDLAEHAAGSEVGLYEDAMAAAGSLTTLSERGRWVPELRDRRTREIFVRDYRLVYEVDAESIAIVAFVSGRRDFATWWQERDG